VHVEVEVVDSHALLAFGAQPHLHPLRRGIPACDMRERVDIEVGGELAVQDAEHVPVELGGDARTVVVGRHQAIDVFHQVGPQQERVTGVQTRGEIGQEPGAGRRGQVADGAPEEGDDPCAVGG
jgi:hypothetical protein